jgi:hypothetical protein
MIKKIYLGDSVYAEWKEEQIILTTENGLPEDPSNLIYLEPEVMEALEIFLTKIKNKDFIGFLKRTINMNKFKIHIGQPAIGGNLIGEACITFIFNEKYSVVKLEEFKKWVNTIVESKGNRNPEAYKAKNNLESFFEELFI